MPMHRHRDQPAALQVKVPMQLVATGLDREAAEARAAALRDEHGDERETTFIVVRRGEAWAVARTAKAAGRSAIPTTEAKPPPREPGQPAPPTHGSQGY